MAFLPNYRRANVGPSGFLAGIYRAVELAAVADELEISKVDLDPELVEAVERGAHYLCRVEV